MQITSLNKFNLINDFKDIGSVLSDAQRLDYRTMSIYVCGLICFPHFVLYNLDWGPVPLFCPLEALQPVWLTPEV
jgi:hypothetical protein